MRADDVVRLRHMLDAAREAVSLCRFRTRADLDTDRTLSLAVVRLLEIVGEAAADTSADLRTESPQVPWR